MNNTPAHADFYVSPDGSDLNPGSWAQPFATLDRARVAVRELLPHRRFDDVVVLLRGGTYHVNRTVVFGREDGAAEGRRVTYAGYPGETAVLSAGLPVTGWRRYDPATDMGGFTAEAAGNLWVAQADSGTAPADRHATGDHAAGASPVNALYRFDTRLPRARSAGFAAITHPDHAPDDGFYAANMALPEGVVPAGATIAGCELVVIPQHTWTMNILPVEHYDPAARVLRMRYPCTYPLLPNRRAASAWLENVPWALTRPGWLCTPDGTIYYWPEDGDEPSGIVAGALTELIRVEGEIDYNGPSDAPVQGIWFSDLTLRHGLRYQWYGQTGWGIQHDWEAFDRPTALVRFRGAERCGVTRCAIHASDGAGIRLDLHAQRIEISGNRLHDLGGCAVVLAGYGPGTKYVNRNNVVLNNHMHDIGKITWHSPAIFLWQSGENRIAHNLLHNTPYTAIVASGRIRWDRDGRSECSRTVRWDEAESVVGPAYRQPVWHQAWKADWDRREPLLHSRNNVIEYNDIHHVMEVMGDGNGVYISGAGGGNVVSGNRVHSSPSPHMAEGIRCDDDQHMTTVADNLVYGLGGFATGITIKGISTIVRNVIACPAVERTRRGMISLEVGPLTGTVIRDNVLLATASAHVFYYQGPRIHGTGPEPLLRDCCADHNIYWNTDGPGLAEQHLERERVYGIELQSRAVDPGFVDPGSGDYRLKPDAPAHELGIAESPAGRAGLLPG